MAYKDKVVMEIRVRITDETLKLKIGNYPHINWSEFTRLAIADYIKKNPRPLNQIFKTMIIPKEKITIGNSNKTD